MKRFLMIALSLIVAVAYGFTWTGQASAANTEGGGNIKAPVTSIATEYKEHEALVMLKTSKSMSSKKTQNMLRAGNDAISDVKVVDSWDFSEPVEEAGVGEKKVKANAQSDKYANVALVRSKSLTTEQLINKLLQRKDVLYAEPNYKVKALSVTNDTYSDLQWSMQDTGGNVNYEYAKGNTGTDDIVVAVVDTGVDYEHEDLAGNMWVNDYYPALKGECGFDFVKGDDDPMDENGHGSHCAGIIGAVGNNEIGISGVNQKISIMALRMLDEDGYGWNSEEIACYNYISKALDLGVPVKAINNSWGGGDYSEIFAKLIDIVGEKGAVSVFAAGNEAANNDEYEEYPTSIESEYSVVVAATKEDGTLASFSNYGEETVDVAAPGADILSTVCYDCYNPSIYTPEEQAAVSKNFNNYEGAETWGIPEVENIPDDVTFEATVEPGKGFLSDNALKLSFKGMDAGDYAFVKVPYELVNEGVENYPYYSAMVCPDVPEGDYEAFFVVCDAPADASFSDEDDLWNYEPYGYYISGNQGYWDHYSIEGAVNDDLEDADADRKVVLAVYADTAGDYDIYIDDMGVSNQAADTSLFKKYDFYCGTSMATPFITGALALKAAELGANVDPLELIMKTVSLTRDDGPDVEVIAGKPFCFHEEPAEYGPRIGSVTVGDEPGTIKINGSGLNPSSGLVVNVKYTSEEDFGAPATILDQSPDGTSVTIKDNGWINNLIDVRVTGFSDKTAKKHDVYLVKGKAEYEAVKAEGLDYAGKLATDGKYIYSLSSDDDSVLAFDPVNEKDGFEYVAEVDYSEIFNVEENETAMYDMLFSRDMACIGGKIYTVVEYGEGVEVYEDDDDDWWFFSNSGRSAIRSNDDEEDYDDYAACGILYSSELRLISIDTKTGTVKNLGALPDSLEKTVDWSLAAYNGKLYFIGGYSMDKGKKGFTKDVNVYDPVKKSWSDGPAIPEGRAFGHVLQSGSDLVYTLGYSEAQAGLDEEQQLCPNNMIFDGSSWKVSGKTITPLVEGSTVKRGKNTYVEFDGNVGLCKDGIVYIGTPAEDYGDTFTYSIKDDAFNDTGYNYSTQLGEDLYGGVSVGKEMFAFDDAYGVWTAPIESGMIKISCGKAKGGKVTGVNRYYNPGDKAKIVAKAKKGFKVKSMKVGSKKIKVKKNATKVTYTTPALTKDLKVKAAFKKK